jgi:hypothetical protein
MSSSRLARVPDAAGMKLLARTIAGAALGSLAVLAAAGAYTESHRVPDQP